MKLFSLLHARTTTKFWLSTRWPLIQNGLKSNRTSLFSNNRHYFVRSLPMDGVDQIVRHEGRSKIGFFWHKTFCHSRKSTGVNHACLAHCHCSLGHLNRIVIINIISNSCAFSTLSKNVYCEKGLIALPAIFSSNIIHSCVEGYSLLFSLK